MEELKVKEGDEVIVTILCRDWKKEWSENHIGKVLYISKETGSIEVLCDRNIRFFDKYGRTYRGKVPSVKVPEDGEIQEIERMAEKKCKVKLLQDYQYQNLPIEVLRELVDIIKKYEENKED